MISIIIPFHNEEENIAALFREIREVMDKEKQAYEVVMINDGSTDKSMLQIEELSKNHNTIKVISNKKRFGKGEAINKGLTASAGDIIIFMDGDLQDDPQDIPHFLHKLHEGYDFVNGIRKTRKDSSIIRIYSKCVNSFLKYVMQSPFIDINCGFKAFRKKTLDDVVLYGNNFRFLPLAAFYKGYKVGEMVVNNRPRIHGVSKFGIGKLFIGIIDTVTAYFLFRFAESPLHFFGVIGGVLFGAGFLLSLYLAVERLFFNMLLYRRPALQLGILLIIIGIQVVMTGIIGELMVYLDKKKNKLSK